jgi:hypothetical protein
MPTWHSPLLHLGFPEFTRFSLTSFPVRLRCSQPIALPTELPGNAGVYTRGLGGQSSPAQDRLHLAASLERTADRHHVGVLEVGPDGQAVGDAGDEDTERLQ